MKKKPATLTRVYEDALNDYIKSGKAAIPTSARGIACNSCTTLENTTVLIDRHEAIVREATQLPCTAAKRIKTADRAAQFLASAISPAVLPGRGACSNCDVRRFAIAALLDRSFVQATVFKQMSEKNALLLAEKQSLKKSQDHCASLLKKSIQMQQELRRLTQQLISAQEDERLKISRELHDVIAQTLTGINIRLATLKQQASLKGKDFNTEIDSTQRMVEKSVNIVHRFAFDLRPPVIDDLGLSSALRSLLKKFEQRTRIKTYFRTCATLDQLDTLQRTALFRVAEEALTNVARHSEASCVIVSAKKTSNGLRLVVKDDGKSFDVHKVMFHRRGKRLGLLGMRERAEMVNGHFAIESSPAEGTAVTVEIPLVPPKQQRKAGVSR